MTSDPNEPTEVAKVRCFLKDLQEQWQLDDSQMRNLFAIDQERLESLREHSFRVDENLIGSDQRGQRNMILENCPHDTDETRERILLLMNIRYELYLLFLKHSPGAHWLRQKQETWGNRAPMDLILSGKLQDLQEAENFVVDVCSGP